MSEVIFWKPVYKLFHWGIALCILLDMFWLEDDPHAWAGYLALAFVILRIVAEFFARTPKYANTLARTVYFTIWLFIAALAVTGWMLGTDEYWGDEQIQVLHENFSTVLMGLIILHAAGLLRNGLLHRDDKWKQMFPNAFFKKINS